MSSKGALNVLETIMKDSLQHMDKNQDKDVSELLEAHFRSINPQTKLKFFELFVLPEGFSVKAHNMFERPHILEVQKLYHKRIGDLNMKRKVTRELDTFNYLKTDCQIFNKCG